MVGVESKANYRIDMQEKIQSIFSGMDSNCDGVISRDEFMEYCQHTDRYLSLAKAPKSML